MEGAATPSSASAPTSKGTIVTAASTTNSWSESIIQRLTKKLGAVNHLEQGPAGLVEFVNQDRSTRLPAVVAALFPDVDEAKDVAANDEKQALALREEFHNLCVEAVVWVQWLLFSGDPEASLADSGLVNGGQRGVCGAVWGAHDIAYRCRTCENDPTCAICVPCFQAGDHRNHDYCMIRTGGGCCDCGDGTAWKRTGFCSKHRGPGLAPSLPPEFASSAGAVLDAVLREWVAKLNAAEPVAEGKPKPWSLQTTEEKVASQMSLAIIDMLLVFCNSSESMLNFTAKYVGMGDVGIINALMRTEIFLSERVVKKLPVLLYKLLGDTDFKSSFAHEFISRYPKFLRDSVQESLSNSAGNSYQTRRSDHSILGNFSVQIFTVPILTRKLVMESKLLDMLLETLKELFISCAGDDDQLLVSKGPIVNQVYIRVVEDIKYVMNHSEVAQYVAQKRPDLCKAWLELVAFVQGTCPQRRVFNIHVEEENEDWESARSLEQHMAHIHPLFAVGAASGPVADDIEVAGSPSQYSKDMGDDDANVNVRHAKLGRITKETEDMDLGGISGVDVTMDDVTNASCAGGKDAQKMEIMTCGRERGEAKGQGAGIGMVPPSLVSLVGDCTNILDKWLALDVAREAAKGPAGQPTSDSGAITTMPRRNFLRGRARGVNRGARPTTTTLVLEHVIAPAPPATPAPGLGLALAAAPPPGPGLAAPTPTPAAAATPVPAPGDTPTPTTPAAIPNGTTTPPGLLRTPPIPIPVPAPNRGTVPTPTATTGPDGPPGRTTTIRDWLRRQRRQHVVEPSVSDESRTSSSSTPSGGGAGGAGDMDVDVSATAAASASGESGVAVREWWMGAAIPNHLGSGLAQLGGGGEGGVGKDWPNVDFDVSKQDVSFHIPVHRALALLLQKAFEAQSSSNGGDQLSSSSSSSGSAAVDHFSLQQFLPDKYQSPSFASFLMEHPLRLQVLCAQVQAGMWRRNGRTTSNLCDLYRTVPWCEDSLELDLLVLQCSAALAPPEMFVERIQTRFGLKKYFNLQLKPPAEYEACLAQEFIMVLIRLGSERGFCGLSQAEALRRELVQRLAVGDATHSSLLRALPRRLQDSKHLEECLNSVAVYRNPSGMQQGKFTLRKERWRELDLYHPRWSPRELQSAEERYFRACKSSPIYMQLPKWKKPFPPLKMMGRFLVSARVHDILFSVFFHAAFYHSEAESRAPEGLFFSAIHLLALALDFCSSLGPFKDCQNGSNRESGTSCQEAAAVAGPQLLNERGPKCSWAGSSSSAPAAAGNNSSDGLAEEPPLLVRSIERVGVTGQAADGTLPPEQHSLISLLVLLLRKHSTSNSTTTLPQPPSSGGEAAVQYTAGDVIKVLLRKLADLHRGCMYEIESLVPEILHRRTVSVPTSSSASASAAGDVDMEPREKAAVTEAQKRKAMARQRQEAIMAKMKAAQEKFALSVASKSDSDQAGGTGQHKEEANDDDECTGLQDDIEITCALCRDSGTASPLCFLTLVQKSRILAFVQKSPPSWERPLTKDGVQGDKKGETASSTSELTTPFEVMYTTADLWNWIQEALGEPGGVREPLHGGEALFEVFRNGLHPGIRNAVRLANAVGLSPGRGTDADDSDAGEAESSGEGIELENADEEGGPSAFSPSLWEEMGLSGSMDWSSREVGHVRVLAEYVEEQRRANVGEQRREQRRAGGVDAGAGGGGEQAHGQGQGQEAGPAPARTRRFPGRNIMDATVNTGLGISDMAGVYLSACGHAVHQDCLDRYLSTLLQRYYSRALFEGVQIVDPDQGEFLCPVCRRLTNSIIPAFPRKPTTDIKRKGLPDVDVARIEVLPMADEGLDLSDMDICCSLRRLDLDRAFRVLTNAENMISTAGLKKAAITQLPDSIRGALETLALRLHGLFNPDRAHVSGVNGRVPQSLHIWDVLRYSLMSAEVATRAHQASLHLQGQGQGSATSGLMILEEVVDARKGSVLPLLLHVAKAVQGQSRPVVLLRSRGMQLIVDAISHGVSRDLFSDKTVKGYFSTVLQYLEKAQDSPDVQFWKRMADPVLLHDPFSSLVWLLFCLPLPVHSGEGPFIALVHIFYLVCLTQAFAYAGSALSSDPEMGPSASAFVTAVQAGLSGTILSTTSSAAENGYVNFPHEGPALALTRRLTLPYLRQCFLLQKLMLGESGQVHPVPSAHLWERSQRHGVSPVRPFAATTNVDLEVASAGAGAVEDQAQVVRELEELDQLESVFAIPPLSELLNDESLHGVALKWCQHVRAESGTRTLGYVPRPVRTTPFKLMRLPYLYQDLLQRYIKERCLRCGTVPDKPALCLLCGTLCCGISSRMCCSVNRQGECYSHAMACGAGIGVFLMLKKTNVLLQRCERQAFWPSPYLDSFGEEDIEYRWKPLFLNEERYAALTAMVASHGLDYSSLVLARTSRQML